MNPKFTVRAATAQDANDIARVNHETWVATYRGILDEESIRNHSLQEQVTLWQQQLGVINPSELRFVAETQGSIVGYTGGGRNPDSQSPFQCELFGIYVLHDYQGQGLGSALTVELAKGLQAKGFSSMLVWVLRENPFRHFYEKLGAAQLEQAREIDYSGKKLSVVCYGWSDLSKLV